jgi:hypothetical protein
LGILFYFCVVSTSVKLSEADKRKLERLQAMFTIRKSKKVTQQEILSRLIGKATEEGDKFLNEEFEGTVPMSDEGYRRMLSLTSDWGVKTKWEEIDDLLYGSGLTRPPRKKNKNSKSQK